MNSTVGELNVSHEPPDKYPPDPTGTVYATVDLVCTVVSLALIPPILFGNTLVLTAISRFRSLHTPTHVLIASLALADLTVGVVSIPAFTLVHHTKFGLERQRTSCLVSYVLSHCPTGVSLLTLFIIAVERYVAIHRPFTYQQLFRRKNTLGYVFIVWLYVWITTTVYMFTNNKWQDSMQDCNFGDVASAFYMFILSGHMVAVLVVTTALHAAVVHTARRHRRAIIQQARMVNMTSNLETNARIAYMLCLVLGMFYLCWIPYLLTLPFALRIQGPDPFWLHAWEQFAGIVVLSHSCLNPLVYAWKNRDFRLAFRRLLHLKMADVESKAVCDGLNSSIDQQCLSAQSDKGCDLYGTISP